jgi:hypothetical protein
MSFRRWANGRSSFDVEAKQIECPMLVEAREPNLPHSGIVVGASPTDCDPGEGQDIRVHFRCLIIPIVQDLVPGGFSFFQGGEWRFVIAIRVEEPLSWVFLAGLSSTCVGQFVELGKHVSCFLADCFASFADLRSGDGLLLEVLFCYPIPVS